MRSGLADRILDVMRAGPPPQDWRAEEIHTALPEERAPHTIGPVLNTLWALERARKVEARKVRQTRLTWRLVWRLVPPDQRRRVRAR